MSFQRPEPVPRSESFDLLLIRVYGHVDVENVFLREAFPALLTDERPLSVVVDGLVSLHVVGTRRRVRAVRPLRASEL